MHVCMMLLPTAIEPHYADRPLVCRTLSAPYILHVHHVPERLTMTLATPGRVAFHKGCAAGIHVGSKALLHIQGWAVLLARSGVPGDLCPVQQSSMLDACPAGALHAVQPEAPVHESHAAPCALRDHEVPGHHDGALLLPGQLHEAVSRPPASSLRQGL